MTNEELALLSKRGSREAITALWEQSYKLIYTLLGKYYPLCPRCGIEPDDLRQAGYFALLRAVESYDPASGLAFNSYLNLHISNTARETLGFTCGRMKPPPSHLSLDAPLDEDIGNTTLADTIEDPGAAFADALIDREATRQSVAALRAEMERLPDQPRKVVLSCLWEGKPLKETAAGLNLSIERVRQLKEQGLRKLRSTKTARAIERGLFPPRHVSLAQFQVDHTSEQERFLLFIEEIKERHRQREAGQ